MLIKNNSCVIVLVNYNGFEDTKACLKSILNSSDDIPFVILVDNASKENVVLENLNEVYPKLKIIRNKDNIGFGRANNIAIEWAKQNLEFTFLLLLNNDTTVEPDSLHYLKEGFKIDSQIGITTGKILYESKRNIVWYGGGDIVYKQGWPKIYDFKSNATSNGANKPKYVSFVSGCLMMFSRCCLEEINGFDDDFFMYCEDLELCMRVTEKGYKMYYEPRSVIYHKVQGSLKKGHNKEASGMNADNPNLEFLFSNMKSNQWLAVKKHYSKKAFLVFTINYWSKFFFQVSKFLLHGRFDSFKIARNTILKINAYAKHSITTQNNSK